MKVTRRELVDLIKEELDAMLSERDVSADLAATLKGLGPMGVKRVQPGRATAHVPNLNSPDFQAMGTGDWLASGGLERGEVAPNPFATEVDPGTGKLDPRDAAAQMKAAEMAGTSRDEDWPEMDPLFEEDRPKFAGERLDAAEAAEHALAYWPGQQDPLGNLIQSKEGEDLGWENAQQQQSVYDPGALALLRMLSGPEPGPGHKVGGHAWRDPLSQKRTPGERPMSFPDIEALSAHRGEMGTREIRDPGTRFHRGGGLSKKMFWPHATGPGTGMPEVEPRYEDEGPLQETIRKAVQKAVKEALAKRKA